MNLKRPKGGFRPVLCVVGARPNYMKVAPILRAFHSLPKPIPSLLIHTGQHYDEGMNARLFHALKLPHPDVNLEVGSGTHAVQTAEVMRRFEPLVDLHQPSCIVVVGDVNSTLACALVASKKRVPVVHVEAGLRSFDRSMPEEINRLVTDQLADVLYTTERSANQNLAREGIDMQRVVFVGNVMIDSLLSNLPQAIPAAKTLHHAGADPSVLKSQNGFGLVTLHRPSNVDQAQPLEHMLTTLSEASHRIPLLFALHPRTQANMNKFGLTDLIVTSRIISLPPQGYLEMLGLLAEATVVMTDSGGIQEETTALAVPCLTLRENTERPITVDQGSNTLVGADRARTLEVLDEVLARGGKRGRRPEFWDGKAAERIAVHLDDWLCNHALA